MKIKELNKNGRRYGTNMKSLHEVFGIDWEKPYCEIEHDGKFTVRSMTKEIADQGHTPDDSILLALVKGVDGWDSDEWHVVRIYAEHYDINMPFCVDRYYRKSDFEDARKKNDCTAIFFAQKTKYLTGAKWEHRSWEGYSYHGEEEKDYHKRFKSARDVPRGYHQNTLDHSGYWLDVYREELNSRVAKYKAEKAKSEYLKTDNSDKISTLARLIDEYKKKLSKAILETTTAEEIRELENLMGYHGLCDIVETFETFRDNTLNKSYGSIRQSNRDYDHVAKKCYEYLG